jgi:tocopherol O-methyltransferase
LFQRGDETPAEAQVALLALCAELAGVRRGSRVLDVGCGHGGTVVYLAREYECRVTGLTVSEKQARLARENARLGGVEGSTLFMVGDADGHDFGRQQYDLVWTMESSEHFRDKAGYMCRVADALISGGRALLAAWTGSMENARVHAVADAFLCPSLQTTDEYTRHMQGAGLEVLRKVDLTECVIPTWEVCLERSRSARSAFPLLPRSVREFAEGIPLILEAYRSGALRYSVMVAEKP